MRPVTDELLEEMSRRIVEEVHPQRVVLFGSRGRGDADAGADVDLIVVEEGSFTEPRPSGSGFFGPLPYGRGSDKRLSARITTRVPFLKRLSRFYFHPLPNGRGSDKRLSARITTRMPFLKRLSRFYFHPLPNGRGSVNGNRRMNLFAKTAGTFLETALEG